VAAVTDAGEQPAGGRADLGPGHLGILDRRAGVALAVDRGDLGATFGQPPGEHPVSAADLERGAAARRDGLEDDWLIVDVVVPEADLSHHASRVRRIPLASCAH